MHQEPPRHLLLLTDRDWTHPQAGGTGTVLYGLISQWLDAGHRVTVIAGDYDGAERVSRYHERLTVHRMGSRLTVFPRAAWATLGTEIFLTVGCTVALWSARAPASAGHLVMG